MFGIYYYAKIKIYRYVLTIQTLYKYGTTKIDNRHAIDWPDLWTIITMVKKI